MTPNEPTTSPNRSSIKGQLTARGLLIGGIGCVILTAASVYTALKMGALPWPIVFAAIISLFFLKALGHTTLNEAYVTHTIMSAGSMVAGGLAFTIPGIWILTGENSIAWWQTLIVALSGTVLGLICTAFIRKQFIEEDKLEFPIGEAAAQTLIAGDSGGKTGAKLFGSMGLAGIYCALRDWLGALPAMFLSGVSVPGVSFGIYNSPMMLAVGFLVGTGAVVAWFLGAVFANFGLIVGASSVGLWDVATGQGIVSSLGMGVMMGCGFGVIVKNILPKLPSLIKGITLSSTLGSSAGEQEVSSEASMYRCSTSKITSSATKRRSGKLSAGILAGLLAAVALVLCFALSLGPLPSIIVVLMVWVTTAMSAQSVGQTGIDPMEIFGLIVLLLVAAGLVAFSVAFLGLELSAVRILAFLAALVLALVLNFFIFYCVALLSFWLTDVNLMFGTISVVLVVVSGGIFPMDIFGEKLAAFIGLLPFSYTTQLPVNIINGKLSWMQVGSGVLCQAFWIVLFGALGFGMWKKGLKRFAAVGG